MFSEPLGLECPGTCSAQFINGTEVVLTAVAEPGSYFQGWMGGACFGNGLCTSIQQLDQTVSAKFVEQIECLSDATTFCLNQGRFRVRVQWTDFADTVGDGRTVPNASLDSGLFWFFDEQNWEMLVKVIDGCGFNDRFWVFAAAATNVEYQIEVLDTVTGQESVYHNALGIRADAITDTNAFDTCP